MQGPARRDGEAPQDGQARGGARAVGRGDRLPGRAQLIAAELRALAARDDETRARLAATGALFHGYHPEMEAVHRANAARLRELVDASGWPGASVVGAEAAHAAWRIVQHAIAEPSFQRAMLAVLGARADVDPADVAALEDRIRVFEGRLQRYGTQYDWDAAGEALVPMNGVEDPASVDARRAVVGLAPIVWRRVPPEAEPPPRDPGSRAAELDAWARRVGWR